MDLDEYFDFMFSRHRAKHWLIGNICIEKAVKIVTVFIYPSIEK